MELQISYHICTEVPEKGILWRETRSDRENTKATMRMERSRNPRSGDMSRPCTYAGKYSAEGSSIELYGYLKGKSSLMIYEQFGN